MISVVLARHAPSLDVRSSKTNRVVPAKGILISSANRASHNMCRGCSFAASLEDRRMMVISKGGDD